MSRDEKARRNQVLLEEQKQISLRKNRARLDSEVDVLVEGSSKRDPDRWTGRTDRNLIVCFPAGRDLTGRLARIRLTDCTPLTLFGDLV